MAAGSITLAEALKILDSGQTIDSLKWVEADRKRGTGGKIAYEECVQKRNWEDIPDSVLKLNKIPLAEKRNPRHHDHSTRNIYITSTRRIKKLHIVLLLELNGRTVLL